MPPELQDRATPVAPSPDSPAPDSSSPLVAEARGSLRRSIYLVGGGITLIIGLVAGALIVQSAARILDQQANDQVSDYAARTSRIVEQSVLERRREVELLATMPWIVGSPTS